MIHLICGDNREKILERSKAIVEQALTASPGALYLKISDGDFDRAKLEELIGSRSLFSPKIIVLCDNLFENAEAVAVVSKKTAELASSENIFIFREGALAKKELEMFKGASVTVEELNDEEGGKRGYIGAREVKLKSGYEDFNIFAFTDTLGRRDRKAAWVLFHKALRAGIPAEELFWKASWLFKNVILVSPLNQNQDELASKLKISPFVIKKSKSFLKNYPTEALLGNYQKLVDIYHGFRRGAVETELAMEQFILNL